MTNEQRISSAMGTKFPDNPEALQHYSELLIQYSQWQDHSPSMLGQIETKDDGQFWSFVWEAMLFRHLTTLEYTFCGSASNAGPDFCVTHNNQRIWIEAVVPSPEGIPQCWLDAPSENGQIYNCVPHEEILLRCTAAIKTKQEIFTRYRNNNIVKEDDCTIIALNICRLSYNDMRGVGKNQLPRVAEAVLPAGDVCAEFSLTNNTIGNMQYSYRCNIKKHNGAEIRTDNFLDCRYSNISAVLQGHQAVLQGHQDHMLDRDLSLSMVHNPKAKRSLPRGLFGLEREFEVEEHSGVLGIRELTK